MSTKRRYEWGPKNCRDGDVPEHTVVVLDISRHYYGDVELWQLPGGEYILASNDVTFVTGVAVSAAFAAALVQEFGNEMEDD